MRNSLLGDDLELLVAATKPVQKAASKSDLDLLLSVASKVATPRNNYGRHYKTLTSKRTEPQMRYYIDRQSKQLKAATYSSSFVRGQYRATEQATIIKHYRATGLATLPAHTVKYYCRLINGDKSEFKKLLEKRLKRTLTNSEFYEIVHRAAKKKDTETTACYIEKIGGEATVYTN